MSDLETKVLAILIQNPDTIKGCVLEVEDFEDGKCRKVYQVLSNMVQEDRVIDVATIDGELGQDGLGYYAETISSEYTPMFHLEDSVKAIRAKRIVREFKLRAQDVKHIEDIDILVEDIKNLYPLDKIMNTEQLIDSYRETIKERRKQESPYILTGIQSIDQLGLLAPTYLVTLAARSSIGKTALAGNLAMKAAMFQQRVLFLTTEMGQADMMDRFYSHLSKVEIWKFKYAKEGGHYAEAENEFGSTKGRLWFVSEPKLSCKFIESAVVKHRPELVVVDYLQLLSDIGSGKDTKNNLIDNVTFRLKQLAMKYKCCVLLLSQVNRQSANNVEGMPLIHELRDSGSIEQTSDVVLILNREKRDDVVAVLHVAKNRHGKSEDIIQLRYDSKTATFTELIQSA